MKNIFCTLIVLSFAITSFGQNTYLSFETERSSNQDVEIIMNESSKTQLDFHIETPGVFIANQTEINEVYQKLNLKGYMKLTEVGKPALPAIYKTVALPGGEIPEINIVNSEIVEYNNMLVYPALKPATDRYGDPEPEFEIDEEFYNMDITYPASPVEIIEIYTIRNIKFALLRITPIQYNPKKHKLIVNQNLKFEVELGEGKIIRDNVHSTNFLHSISRIGVNYQAVDEEIRQLEKRNEFRSTSNGKNYIIITTDEFKQAADSLAMWKMQMGYSTEVISQQSWTASQVKEAIKTRYDNWTPKPDYFVIIGDNEDVPGETLPTPDSKTFASDLYYACMDGGGDYVPDIAHGRISVSYASQANSVIQKIINYERNPVQDTNFYKNGLNCAQYQDESPKDNYADRRFALTSEEVRNYMQDDQDYNIYRVYSTESNVTPLYYNNGSFSNGESIPEELKKPGFAWDGDDDDIANYINQGVFYVLHRDHGYAGGSGWHRPYFTTTSVRNKLSNQEKTPVVFSINCHTGEFQLSECFAEAFLRHSNGGAVGVMAAAYLSYSGYNDALTLGMFDAIWANPGIKTDFTGSNGKKNPPYTQHDPIYTMGDVLNHGLNRMIETWGVNVYTFELFHWFGDPAMKIWTEFPIAITASAPSTIACGSTSLQISNLTTDEALVTLVVDGELIASKMTSGSNLTLDFSKIAGNQAILTISKSNNKPFVKEIDITGGCPKASFTVDNSTFCVDDEITFTDISFGTNLTYDWDFGTDAYPQKALTAGPHKVVYATHGIKTISLTVINNVDTSVYEKHIIVDEFCKYFMPKSGSITIDKCSGFVYDDGGKSDYNPDINSYLTIQPTGASEIELNFNEFGFEDGFDSLIIYDGPNSSSKRLGAYTGFDLPAGGLIKSSGSVVTLQQYTDPREEYKGFEIRFQCNYKDIKPESKFIAKYTSACNGKIEFFDISANYPTSWKWNFGDGNSATSQNPKHTYLESGTYTVTLIATNQYGTDTFTRESYISIEYPVEPLIFPADNCGEGAVELKAEIANGKGIVEWFDTIQSGTLLESGSMYTTPSLTESKTYYVQSNSSKYEFGPKDNTFGSGSYYNYGNEHGLVFNVHKPCILQSVYLYAQGTKNRTISLINTNNEIYFDTTIMIEHGEHRINLNIELPVENNLTLKASGSPGFYRNNSGATFPYIISDFIEITKTTASAGGYYYFFYDWLIEDLSMCVSPRKEIVASIRNDKPVADFTYTDDSSLHVKFTNTSENMQSFVWDLGNGTIDSVNADPETDYRWGDYYHVKLWTKNACGEDADSQWIYVFGSQDELNDTYLKLYPNPNNGRFVLETDIEEKAEITIYNMNGKLVYRSGFENLPAKTEISISEAKGLYILKITTEKEQFVKNIIVQ